MTDDEVAAFLDEQRRAHFATINADGTPHVVPVNYALIDGKLAFWGDPGSQKVANIRRDPRVTYLVEAGDRIDAYKGVQIRGRADVVDDEDVVQAVGDGFFRNLPPGIITDEIRQATRELGLKRVAVAVTPEKVISWDHTKMPGIRAEDVGR